MSPSSRVHPPACLIWTFRRVSFACGPRPCLYFQCLFVSCPTCIQTNGLFEVSLCLHYVSLRVLVLTSHSVHAPTHVDEIDWCSEINCVSCKEIKVWSVSMIEMTQGGGSVGFRGSILYIHKRNERIVPTLVLFQSILGPRDEIERERVVACVIPKADSKFWTGDHSIRIIYKGYSMFVSFLNVQYTPSYPF